MKCKICKQKTDWDSSVGRPCFIVCNNCVEKFSHGLKAMIQMYNANDDISALGLTTAIMLNIGYRMEENKKED